MSSVQRQIQKPPPTRNSPTKHYVDYNGQNQQIAHTDYILTSTFQKIYNTSDIYTHDQLSFNVKRLIVKMRFRLYIYIYIYIYIYKTLKSQ